MPILPSCSNCYRNFVIGETVCTKRDINAQDDYAFRCNVLVFCRSCVLKQIQFAKYFLFNLIGVVANKKTATKSIKVVNHFSTNDTILYIKYDNKLLNDYTNPYCSITIAIVVLLKAHFDIHVKDNETDCSFITCFRHNELVLGVDIIDGRVYCYCARVSDIFEYSIDMSDEADLERFSGMLYKFIQSLLYV